MKRTLSLLLALCFMTVSLSGCKDDGSSASGNPSESSPSESSVSENSGGVSKGGILKDSTGKKVGTINPFVYKLTSESEVAQLTSMKLYAFFPSEQRGVYL